MAYSTVSNFSVFQEDSGSGVLVTVTSLSERKINDKQPGRGVEKYDLSGLKFKS